MIRALTSSRCRRVVSSLADTVLPTMLSRIFRNSPRARAGKSVVGLGWSTAAIRIST